MATKIHTLCLPLPYRLGTVNCYLLETGFAFILIDTGCSSQRATMEQALRDAGCSPGDLKLILLTHGDFDHTGNAAHLRQVFSAPVGMHPDDTRMLAEGDMFANRKSNNWLVRKLGSVMFQFGKAEQFEPDLQLVDGDELIDYGLNAHVISLPGHSCGSIGILMESGEFFCGDLFENDKRPMLSAIMDDPMAASVCAARLSGLAISTVYPGHGAPFCMQSLF